MVETMNIFCVLTSQGIGDRNLAHQCFKLTLANNNDHAESYNNLAVLEMQKGHIEQVSIKFKGRWVFKFL